ncbi:Tudor domain-containing protein 3, partial [Stegodyphus mimosarum]
MDIEAELKEKGWHFSKEGFELCKDGLDRITVSSVIQKAIDMDLRDIGGNFFPEDISRGKLESITGAGVVQIQKIKNASAPKYEYGSGAPAILRLLLTDGNAYVNCLQWGQWKSITMDTPPGTKIFLKPGKINIQNSFLLLSENQFTVLGGCVAPMVEKWELCRRLASHVRTKEDLDGNGPPPWIPFGKPISSSKPLKSGNFKSLETEAKEAKENEIFKQQRMANIAEVARMKETKAKVFGGGKDIKPTHTKQEAESFSNSQFSHSNNYEKPLKNHQVYESKPSPSKKQYEETFPKNQGRNFQNHEFYRTQVTNDNPNHGQSYSKDRRIDQRNKFNANNTQNFKNQGIMHQLPTENLYGENTYNLNPAARSVKNPNVYEPSKVSNNDKYFNNSKYSDMEDLSFKTSQVKLHGYENRSDKDNFAIGKPFLKPGAIVLAKYWEDNKYYRATVHAVGKEGKTCVVHFMEYGNYEEVLVDDVQQINSGWNAGPLSFHPSHWNELPSNYNQYQDFKDLLELQRNPNKSYGQYQGRQDRQKQSRQDHRPTAKLYQ